MISSTAPLLVAPHRAAPVRSDAGTADQRWPVQVRVGIIVGGSALLWGGIAALIVGL